MAGHPENGNTPSSNADDGQTPRDSSSEKLGLDDASGLTAELVVGDVVEAMIVFGSQGEPWIQLHTKKGVYFVRWSIENLRRLADVGVCVTYPLGKIPKNVFDPD